jgi:hypothetical protein
VSSLNLVIQLLQKELSSDCVLASSVQERYSPSISQPNLT